MSRDTKDPIAVRARHVLAMKQVTEAMIELHEAAKARMRVDPPHGMDDFGKMPPDEWLLRHMTTMALVQTFMLAERLGYSEIAFKRFVHEAAKTAVETIEEGRKRRRSKLS